MQTSAKVSQDHAAYLQAAKRVIGYMNFFLNGPQGEAPCQRTDVARCLARMMIHLADAHHCRDCSETIALHAAEEELRETHRVFACSPFSKRLENLRIEVLFADANLPEIIFSPLQAYLSLLEKKSGNMVAARVRETMRSMGGGKSSIER